VQTLPPLLSAGLRFLLAGAILGSWLVARHGRAALRIDRAQLGGAALVGMLLLAGGNGSSCSLSAQFHRDSAPW
jgi:hypothetical protein